MCFAEWAAYGRNDAVSSSIVPIAHLPVSLGFPVAESSPAAKKVKGEAEIAGEKEIAPGA